MPAQRELLRVGNDAVCQCVRVRWALFRASALRAVGAGGGRLGFGIDSPEQGADVNFLVAVRAFHMPPEYRTAGICHLQFQSSPLPERTQLRR